MVDSRRLQNHIPLSVVHLRNRSTLAVPDLSQTGTSAETRRLHEQWRSRGYVGQRSARRYHRQYRHEVLGRVARGDNRENSDVDFLGDVEPGRTLLDVITVDEESSAASRAKRGGPDGRNRGGVIAHAMGRRTLLPCSWKAQVSRSCRDPLKAALSPRAICESRSKGRAG